MSSRFLLRCPQCDLVHPVDATRIGLPFDCACGRRLEVRSLRELRELPAADEPVAGAASTWNERQGLIFLAGLSLVSAAIVAAAAAYFWFGLPQPVISAEMMRQAQEQMTLKESGETWRSLRRSDLGDVVFPEERNAAQYMERFRSYRAGVMRWLGLSVVLAIVGGTLGGVAATLRPHGSPRPGPAPAPKPAAAPPATPAAKG